MKSKKCVWVFGWKEKNCDKLSECNCCTWHTHT